MLPCLGVRVKGPTILYGSNQGMVQSSTLIDLECKKTHIAISYYKLQEYVAARIVNPVKVGTKMNLTDFLTKGTAWKTHCFLPGMFFGWRMVGDGVNMMEVKL